MRLIDHFVGRYIAYSAVAVLLTACVTLSAPAQQNNTPGGSAVDDWSHHHVIFSDPGTEQDAIAKGKHEEWLRIVNNPRYRMQQLRRGAAARQASHFGSEPWNDKGHERGRETLSPASAADDSIQRDWTVALGAAGASTAVDTYPAKFTFNVNATPSCTQDFVVYPVAVAGSTTQANLIGVNNLYKTTCTGTVPNVQFAYNVGTGVVQTSPVLSLDGTKVAFVESINGALLNLAGSFFHVLKLGTNGNTGCPGVPCNGNARNTPVAPGGTLNNAVDVKIQLAPVSLLGLGLEGSTDFNSSPFIDYTNDIAYVGDANGSIHKITGVFFGTPTEVTTGGWPFIVPTALLATPASFGSPVFDGGASQNIYIASINTGKIYCVTAAGVACANSSIQAGTGGIQDGPIVDSTTEKVFVTNNNGSSNALLQVSTSLAASSLVTVNMGTAGSDLYNGTFDNLYYASGTNTGHMYFCGNGTLYQIPVTNGNVATTAAATTFKLSTTTGLQADCTPLTEVFNPNITIGGTTGHDLLFLGVKNNGAPTGCNSGACIMTFDITSGAVPTAPIATLPLGTGTTLLGTSGIVIDNVSTTTGASQVYFGNRNAGTGVQASQSGLQ